jgi:hypothetical protein
MPTALGRPLQHFLSCPGSTGSTRASMREAGLRSQDEPWTLGSSQSSPRVREWGRPRWTLRVPVSLGLVLAVLAWPALAQAHETAHEKEQRLPTLGAAPDY